MNKKKRTCPSRKGFALVVTLTLMILLTVVAVGLLSLSSIALRSTSKAEAKSIAQANARLAMLMAIGQLQSSAGSDRAISAPASIVDPSLPSGVTGIWRPWAPEDAMTRNKAGRDSRFTEWLTSNGNSADPANNRLAPPVAADGSPGSVRLLGSGSLGSRSTSKGDKQSISLPLTRVETGNLAWVTIDEGAKARLDLFDDPAAVQTWSNVARAGTPKIEGIRHVDGWEDFKVGESEHGKLISMSIVPLAGQVGADLVSVANPDLTVHSTSLLTNPVSGGLKHDLSLFSSRPLGNDEKSEPLYRPTGLVNESTPSDPLISLLADYHQLYKRLGQRDGTIRPGPREIAPKVPASFIPGSRRHVPPYTESGNTITINRNQLTESMLVPTLVRVDMIFSMITRLTHGGWAGTYGANRHLLHMQYLPVVTLHNPYSVPMVFEGLKVTFRNMPVGFNFMVNGRELSTRLVALNQMYVHYAGHDSNSKDFGITLRGPLGSGGSTTLRLEPGQTKLFGMPRVPPNWTWFDESPGRGADGIHLFDWRSNKTSSFEMGPTMLTTSNTSAAGFDIDWINPQALHTAAGTAVAGGARGMVALNPTDQLAVKFGPYAPPAGGGRFSVGIELIRSGSPVKVGGINVTYGDQNRLNELLSKGTSVRYPQPRSFPAIYPRPRVDPPINTLSIYEPGTTPLRDYVMAKPFMIFSLAAKTTLESFLPTRNLIDGNPSCNIIDIDLTRRGDPYGATPVELVMMPISAGTPAIDEIRGTEEGFFFTGNSAANGTPRSTLIEIPTLPAQSLAQFRHANLASSGFMPLVTYTVGESLAHPRIGTDAVRQLWTDRSVMLDHTFLANEALWDRWFLSTIADQAGPMYPRPKPFIEVMKDFFDGREELINPRIQPATDTFAKIPSELKQTTAGNTAYQKIAAHLTLAGGFNVNSTSVDAWKAVLGALRDAPIETVEGLDELADTTPMPRIRRPAEKSIESAALPTRVKRWQGLRRLDDDQIAELARELVAEIRSRGPFLSLSDFVNREIGAESDTTLKGALQAAIDRSGINAAMLVDGKELNENDFAADSYNYRSNAAGAGNSASHGPGFVTQGDVLSAIGSRITVRSDTFRIRSYGEATNPAGTQVLARAWCEVVVQRMPGFIDSDDAADQKFADLRPMNAKFGRRFEIISFRWLSEKEV